VLRHHAAIRYLLAFALCALTAAVALPLRGWLDQANTVMLFLLAVFIAAVRLGRGPAVLTAFLGVALFDVFFVLPHLSLTVADAQYLVTFAVMLAVGLITTHLTSQLAERREEAQARERETRMLYELARDLGAALTVGQAVETVGTFLRTLGMDAAFVIDRGGGGREDFTQLGQPLDAEQLRQAVSAYRGSILLAGDAGMIFLPFSGTTRLRGVLAVAPMAGTPPVPLPLLNAVASLAGLAIERLHYAEVAQKSELDAQTEKLRASLLSSISHDLRTPLTSVIGLADALADTQSGLPASAMETAAIIRDQAHAMHSMVTNLLEMARLRSGRVILNLQWQPLDEIVGSSLRLLDEALAQRHLVIDLPDDLPLIRFDAVLMERVLCNLLENAVKYSAVGATIGLSARAAGGELAVSVCNDGAGFPPDLIERVFEPFERGAHEPTVPGTGIGLAICRAIIAAHGGTIAAANLPGRACVRFALPLGTPPILDEELP
jgi:two-component system sensor histidine kinase KdpD